MYHQQCFCCSSEVLSHRLSTSGTNIVGDILYNIAVGDEEGRSRQRILAFAAKRYECSAAVSTPPTRMAC